MKTLRIMILVTLVVIMVASICVPATARSKPYKGQVLSVDGSAFGAKSRFAGRFNWRGKYKGFYMAQTGISHRYSYRLGGATYYPMVEWDGRFKGSWVRDASTVRKVTWRDSRVW